MQFLVSSVTNNLVNFYLHRIMIIPIILFDLAITENFMIDLRLHLLIGTMSTLNIKTLGYLPYYETEIKGLRTK